MTADLFGPGLKAQLMQTATLPEIPDEAALLQAVADKVGPYASHETLLWHLRASRGKVHWAVNSYLRAVLSSPYSAQEDFDPRQPLQPPLHQLAAAAASAGAQAPDRQHLGSSSCSSRNSTQHALRSAGSKPCEDADLAARSAGAECTLTNTAACASSSPVSPDQNSSGAQQDSLAAVTYGAAAAAAASSPPAAAPAPAPAPAAAAGSPAAAAPPPVQLDALPGNVLEQVLSCLDLASLLHAACSCQALHRAAQAEELWRQLFQARWGVVVFPINSCGNSNSSGSSSSGTSSSTSRTVWWAPVGQQLAAAAAAARAAGAGAGAQSQARAPVPLFAASSPQQQHGPALPDSPATSVDLHRSPAAAAAEPAGPCAAAAAAAAAASVSTHQQGHSCSAPACQQQQQEAEQSQSGIASSWTGSSRVAGGSSGTLQQQQQPPQPQSPIHSPVPSSDGNAAAAEPPSTAAQPSPSRHGGHPSPPQPQHQQQQQTQQQQPQCRLDQQQQPPQGKDLADGVAVQPLPTCAPCGSWQRQFRQQYHYAASRLCPQCGASTIMPIVYGFPSAPLLSGMAAKRLVLGGDHLIESCHVWACSGCRSCFRFYPFCNVQLWMQDDAQQQRQEHARAAGRGGGQGGGAAGEQGGVGGGGGGGGGQQQQGGGGEGGAQPGSDGAGHGFPRYTYEL